MHRVSLFAAVLLMSCAPAGDDTRDDEIGFDAGRDADAGAPAGDGGGDATDDRPAGEEGGACFPNDTCFAGLDCVENVCAPIADDPPGTLDWVVRATGDGWEEGRQLLPSSIEGEVRLFGEVEIDDEPARFNRYTEDEIAIGSDSAFFAGVDASGTVGDVTVWPSFDATDTLVAGCPGDEAALAASVAGSDVLDVPWQSNGYERAVVARLDAAGEVMWSSATSNTAGITATAVSCAADGSVIVAGSLFFSDWQVSRFTFAPGTAGEAVFEGADGTMAGYVARFDPSGSLAWVVRSVSEVEGYHGVAPRAAVSLSDGSVVVMGEVLGDVADAWSAGSSTVSLPAGPVTMFALRITASGVPAWGAVAFASSAGPTVHDAALLPGDAVAVVATMEGTAGFAPPVGSLVGDGAVLAVIGSDGAWQRGRRLDDVNAVALASDDAGRLAVIGTPAGPSPFGVVDLSAATGSAMIVGVLEADLSLRWGKVAAVSDDSVFPRDILVQGDRVYVTGSTGTPVTFGGGEAAETSFPDVNIGPELFVARFVR